jgi:hypothetical protein
MGSTWQGQKQSEIVGSKVNISMPLTHFSFFSSPSGAPSPVDDGRSLRLNSTLKLEHLHCWGKRGRKEEGRERRGGGGGGEGGGAIGPAFLKVHTGPPTIFPGDHHAPTPPPPLHPPTHLVILVADSSPAIWPHRRRLPLTVRGLGLVG